MNLWTIYDKPLDFPGKYVARRFKWEQPTSDCYAHPDIEKVREWVQEQGMQYGIEPVPMKRSPNDDPVIVETWL